MNEMYDERQISEAARSLNFVKACKIVQVDHESKEILLQIPSKISQTVRIHPSDFEIETYEAGMFCDLILGTMNGMVQTARLLGKTPPTFIPECWEYE